ncbi:hypothetical protein CH063_11470 [Colletotrichum higginsianum]|uniref:Uncharacterized protein n=1 Tax=Colletotrichum higginsianum (strain IMI 349063) TaxID=759273 RepID=H1VLI6_COLHI|nr:hypothetical protein CH063_11470 [Colletotrichum higginsianum]
MIIFVVDIGIEREGRKWTTGQLTKQASNHPSSPKMHARVSSTDATPIWLSRQPDDISFCLCLNETGPITIGADPIVGLHGRGNPHEPRCVPPTRPQERHDHVRARPPHPPSQVLSYTIFPFGIPRATPGHGSAVRLLSASGLPQKIHPCGAWSRVGATSVPNKCDRHMLLAACYDSESQDKVPQPQTGRLEYNECCRKSNRKRKAPPKTSRGRGAMAGLLR